MNWSGQLPDIAALNVANLPVDPLLAVGGLLGVFLLLAVVNRDIGSIILSSILLTMDLMLALLSGISEVAPLIH
ncbi:MAG: hypothetical protein ACYC1C_15035 [Chloroflexota bacterium]|nr:hypothetical protein [Dehalococcoidales bacterium]